MIKKYKNFEVDYYPKEALLVWKIKSIGIPNFTLEALKEFKIFADDLRILFSDNTYPLKYIASASLHNEVYNMGGDLPFFFKSIINKDKEALKEYAHLCIDAIYNIYYSFGLPALSIALVEGNAYGGGFECVMAHDVILANHKSQFCLPENKFHLFPGMGAYSFLFRKLNFKTASEMLYGGKMYDAIQLQNMGLINDTFESNAGVSRISDYIKQNSYTFNFNHHKCLKRVFPLQKAELLDITDAWVNACMNLESEGLRRMELVINAQLRKLKQEV